MHKVAYSARVLVVLTVSCVLSGCGPSGPEIASVEGTVKMDGKPLEFAAVVFILPGAGRQAP